MVTEAIVSVQIAVFVSSSDAVEPGWLLSFLRNISATEIRKKQMNLVRVCALPIYLLHNL